MGAASTATAMFLDVIAQSLWFLREVPGVIRFGSGFNTFIASGLNGTVAFTAYEHIAQVRQPATIRDNHCQPHWLSRYKDHRAVSK